MDELEAVDKLVEQARREGAPATDVGAAVIRRLRASAAPRVLPLWVVAAAAAVAAAAVLVLAIHAWTVASDPNLALFPTVEVAQL